MFQEKTPSHRRFLQELGQKIITFPRPDRLEGEPLRSITDDIVRLSARCGAQGGRRFFIDLIADERDPVVSCSIFCRDRTTPHIAKHGLLRAGEGVAVTAGSRSDDTNDITRAAMDDVGIAERDFALRIGIAEKAGNQPRARTIDAPACHQRAIAVACRDHRFRRGYFKLHDGRKPAAKMACPAGIALQPITTEEDRHLRFADFDRRVAQKAGGAAGAVTAIAEGRTAATAANRADGGHDRAAAPVAGLDVHDGVSAGGGSGNKLGQGLCESADGDDLGHGAGE
ncbi:hypothetical protein D3C72_1346050 [compost metagenome]